MNFKKFRIITLNHGEGSGIQWFVFPPQANHGNIFETLDAHGYEPNGRHNGSMYDCSGMECCSRINILDGKRCTVASQHFYRDI